MCAWHVLQTGMVEPVFLWQLWFLCPHLLLSCKQNTESETRRPNNHPQIFIFAEKGCTLMMNQNCTSVSEEKVKILFWSGMTNSVMLGHSDAENKRAQSESDLEQ